MKYILLPLRILYVVYAVITFLLIMFLILPFVVVGSFFGKIRGGNFIYFVCSIWADLWYLSIGIYHKNLYESPHDKSKQYIFVANHLSYFDATVIVKALRQPLRVLGRSEMSRLPFFWIYIPECDRNGRQEQPRAPREECSDIEVSA